MISLLPVHDYLSVLFVLQRPATVVVLDVILETLQLTVSGTLHLDGGTVNRMYDCTTVIGTAAMTALQLLRRSKLFFYQAPCEPVQCFDMFMLGRWKCPSLFLLTKKLSFELV